jgi:AraC-like DNA-binding protein
MARKDMHALEEWPIMARQARYKVGLLAKSLKICPRQLQRYTQELFGSSPQYWLNEQRLTDAAAMLKEDQLVKTVSLELGFKCTSHFSREFKFRYGISPSKFQVWIKFQKSQYQTNANGA